MTACELSGPTPPAPLPSGSAHAPEPVAVLDVAVEVGAFRAGREQAGMHTCRHAEVAVDRAAVKLDLERRAVQVVANRPEVR